MMEPALNEETADTGSQSVGSADVAGAYFQYAPALKSFLVGVLRDDAAAEDAIQATFAQFLEKGGGVESGACRSWLFKVAYHQAMLVRRQSATRRKHVGEVWRVKSGGTDDLAQPSDRAMRMEQAELVQRALGELSEEQRVVVMARIHEGVKFREIAEALNVPLGTVLGRMQSALKKLRIILSDES